ncbi:MAG: FixH family protein [Melioribacteraceae bacterium]
MNLFENFNISISGNPLFLILGLLIILAYSIYIYKITLPKINLLIKSFLIFLRAASLFLIFILLFDPVITTTTKEKNEPVNLLFIDNSKSVKEISIKSELKKVLEISESINDEELKSEIYSFGSNIKLINNFDSISFNDLSTQFDNIFKLVKQKKNVSSIIIISDGINNQGSNPINIAGEMGIPIFTIGLGDSSTEADVEIQKISTNEFIYSGRKTEIEVSISNKNLTDKNAIIQLIENGKIISNQEIKLSETGINRTRFPYSNEKVGEHKIIANVILKGEEKNKNNNSKSVLINILETKQKIAILSGGPSADLSIVVSSLTKLEDYEISPIIQITENKYLYNKSDIKILKDSDIFFLIGFPSENTHSSFIKSALAEISNSKKPIFFIFTNNLDFTKLNEMKNILPFSFTKILNSFNESQVTAQNINYSIIGNSKEEIESWEKLPPINLTKTKIIPSAESKILLTDKVTNQPILFTNSANKKSVVLTAANFWRWKIQTSEIQTHLIDNLLINSIKWLSLNSENQKFNLKTQKKIFSIGEKVIFNANYYDDTFEPINDANLEVEIQFEKSSQKVLLNPIDKGLYETEFIPNESGTYHYKLISENERLNFSSSFFVDPIELELLTKKSDRNFLRELSYSTNGKYYDINSVENLVEQINSLYQNKINYNYIDNELRISFLHLILLMVVLLFSIEWIIRKVLRML